MNASEIHDLACAYAENPNEETMERALSAALPLCSLIARRFSGRGVEYEDLKQVAAMACVSALKSFEPERGLKFTTYVTPTITGKVRNYLRDKAELMRTPRGVKEQMGALVSAREGLTRELHREPSPRELAERLDWTMERVLDTLSAMEAGKVTSLSAPDEDGLDMESRLSVLEDGFEKIEHREDLQRAFALLGENEKRLLTLRFAKGLSKREAAQKLDMSQMQVSRAERRALSVLKKEMESAV